MSKPKKKDIGSSRPATKGDIEQLREDFQADLVKHTYSKDELDEKFAVFSRKQEEDKQDIIQELKKKTDQDKQEIIREFHVSVEQQQADLQGAHEDELAAVEGKKNAPKAWKSMPRRLKTAEVEIEKIKDHLEIS